MRKKGRCGKQAKSGVLSSLHLPSIPFLVAGIFILVAAILLPSLVLLKPAAVADPLPGDLTAGDKCGAQQVWLWRESEAKVDEVLDQMAAAGIGWMRMDFFWTDIEPYHDEWHLDRHNMVVDKARARGINILGILCTTPEWAGGGSLNNYPSTNLDDWNEYVAQVSSEFAGRVGAWEIWNEQNIASFAVVSGDKEAQYMNLVKRASEEIRVAAPQALIVLGGVAGYDPVFIEECLKDNNGEGDEDVNAGAADYVDAIAYHPYPQATNMYYADHPNHPHEQGMRDKLQDLRDLVNQYAASGTLGLWITEVGWTNSTGLLMPRVDKPTQAAYAFRTFLNYFDDAEDISTDPPLEKVFYYNLWDQCHKDNTLLKTNNGGSTWTRLNMLANVAGSWVNYTNGLEGVAAKRRVSGDINTDVVIAVGPPTTNTSISICSDSGGVWYGQSPPLPGHPGAVANNLVLSDATSVNWQNAWTVGGNGSIYRGVDWGWGMGWSHQPSGTSAFLNAISAVDLNNLWVVGENGTILKTTNGGTNWSVPYVTQPTTKHLNGVAAVSASIAWVVGQDGTIFKTSDGGSTWVPQAVGLTPNHLNGVYAVDGSTAWAVGDGGVILNTTNGTNWTIQSSPTSDDLNAVSALNGSTVWIVGDGATMMKTTNGGANWAEQTNLPNTTDQLTSLSVIDANTVYAAGYKEPWPSDEHPEGDPLGITPQEQNNFGLLDYMIKGKPSFKYVQRLVDPSAGGELFRDAGAISSAGLVTFSSPPATMEEHLFQMEDGSLLFGLWNSDKDNDDPNINITFTLNDPTYADPVTVNLLDGTTQLTPGVSRGAGGEITVTGLTIGKDPKVLKFTAGAPPIPAPTVTGIIPNKGDNNGVVNITNLAGTNFRSGATVKLTKSGQPDITASNVVVVSSTQITCNLDLNGKVVGPWDVVVTNDDSQSGTLSGGFTIEYPAPTVTGITPNKGDNNGIVVITNLAGTNFRSGVNVKLAKSGQADIPATGVVVVTSIKITCSFDINNAAIGPWDVVVTNSDGKSGTLAGGFTVENPTPTVTGITPNKGDNNGTVAITNLAGTSFRSGATVKLTKSGQADIAATSVVVVSSTQITCAFDLNGKAVGAWDVVVTNIGGKSGTLAGGFTIEYPAPTVTSITPNSGKNNGSVSITNLAGTNFRSGATVKLTKSGQTDIAATSVVVVSSTKITCTLNLSGKAVGLWNVVVTNTDGKNGTLPNGFTIQYPAAPTITSITPSAADWDTTVSITNLAGTGFQSGATVKMTKSGYADLPATNVVVASSTKITCSFNLTNRIAGKWNVVVTNPDGQSVTKSNAFTVNSAFYFAEGYTGDNFEEYLCLYNPGTANVTATVTYMYTDGTTLVKTYTVPQTSRTTIVVRSVVGSNKNVAAKITAPDFIVAERPMYFNYNGVWSGGHCVVGAKALSKTFYFAEGYTGSTFEEYLCLLNPGTTSATVTVTYMFDNGTTQTNTYTVGTKRRTTVNVKSAVGADKNVSMKVTSNYAIAAERPMYFNYNGVWSGGHDVVGATATSTSHYFAEGYTGTNFDEYLCLFNPGASVTTATITYMFEDGSTQPQTISVPSTSRITVNVRSVVGSDRNVSMKIISTGGIVAERPMYFNYNGVWSGGHVVVGTPATSTAFYFAEGYTAANFNEYLCLFNPGTTPSNVTITYMIAGTPQIQNIAVPARSRVSVNVNSVVGADKNVSMKITAPAGIVAERPMYFNYNGVWSGGHCTVGLIAN